MGIRAVRMSMASMRRWPMRSILEKQFQKADAITLPDESWPAPREVPGQALADGVDAGNV
jgi:hypothetical protein